MAGDKYDSDAQHHFRYIYTTKNTEKIKSNEKQWKEVYSIKNTPKIQTTNGNMKMATVTI